MQNETIGASFTQQSSQAQMAQSTPEASQNMAATPPEKKTTNKLLIVIIVIETIAIIGLTIALVMSMNNKCETAKCECEKETESVKEESDKVINPSEKNKVSERNTQREDDLARVITAINNYQANNNGKTPFRSGTNPTTADTLSGFVTRYIDRTCSGATAAPTTVKSPNVTFSSCGAEFSDPLGGSYYVSYGGDAESIAEGGLDVSETIPKTDDGLYGFTGYSYASCGDGAKIVKGAGVRDVAVFMRLEGGDIVCNDNH